jgi:MYXO-CTERM domain-containing protein
VWDTLDTGGGQTGGAPARWEGVDPGTGRGLPWQEARWWVVAPTHGGTGLLAAEAERVAELQPSGRLRERGEPDWPPDPRLYSVGGAAALAALGALLMWRRQRQADRRRRLTSLVRPALGCEGVPTAGSGEEPCTSRSVCAAPAGSPSR